MKGEIVKVIRTITKTELSDPKIYIEPGTKLRLHMKDKKQERFTHVGRDFVTIYDWNDYDYGVELGFKEGTYCYLKDIESIEILED